MKKVKCPKCKYEWETKSKLKMVTCPSCQLKVKIERSLLKWKFKVIINPKKFYEKHNQFNP